MPEACLDVIRDFLAQKRIAVVGVSRNPKDFSAGLFRELRSRGYDAVPVNPSAGEIEGLPCFESVQDIQPPVDGALLMTPPDVTATVVKDCHEAGVPRVWLYRAVGTGAVNRAAIEFCQWKGIRVVPGYCPYMFLPETAAIHRLHALVLKIVRSYPA